jgi:hypothetical protein
MSTISRVILALAAVAFILAVVGSYWKMQILGVPAEAYSRAATNLALIAIGLALCFKSAVSDSTGD